MLNKKYVEMTKSESVIRRIYMYGLERAKAIGAENVFDYSLGNPSVDPPAEYVDAAIDLLKHDNAMHVHGYSPNSGMPEARKAIAEDLNKRYGTNYTDKNVFMSVSAAGAIAHAIRAVVTPEEGQNVIVFAPFFPEYVHYVTGTGAEIRVVPADFNGFQINFDEFEKLIDEKTAAVLVNSPNNPSGIVYSTETIDRLAAILKERSAKYGHVIYLISDEPYREIVFEGVDAPFIAKHYDNTIICYSYSKSMSVPGARTGYCIINTEAEGYEDFVPVCVQISRGIGHNCPPTLMQLAVSRAPGALSDLAVYEKNMNILYDELTRLGFEIVKPGGTFYMLPKALCDSAEEFCEKAKEFDLLLVPATGFGAPGYFRIAYCTPTEKVVRSLEAFRKLAAFYTKKS
jgi:aspartate aminotransferase